MGDSSFQAGAGARSEVRNGVTPPGRTIEHVSTSSVSGGALDQELGHDSGIAVVSTHVSGVRLSDALKKPRSAEFALQLVRQLMPALTALHEHGPSIAHGALTPDRVVLTSDGRLMIREHMVGSAVEGRELSAAELWADFGVLVPPSRAPIPRLDDRSDVAQLALVALSLVAGRRIGPDEYPQTIREVLNGIVRLEVLRQWLERALQIDDRGFKSSREATEALGESQHEPRRDDGFEAALRSTPPPAPRYETPPPSPPKPVERQHPLAPTGIVPMSPSRRPAARALRWVAIAAGIVALGEAAFIGRLLLSGSDARADVIAPSVIESPLPRPDAQATDLPTPVTPLSMRVEQEMPGLRVLPAVAAADVDLTIPDNTASNKELTAVIPPKSGGLRVSSSIELHVLDGERVLGSIEDGPIMARAGRQELEFVNSVIGYRVRRQVDVKAGQITSLSIVVPNGTLNINATPWAAIWIDGTAYGETPLGNLSIVPGEHEIVFRHPQLGRATREDPRAPGGSSPRSDQYAAIAGELFREPENVRAGSALTGPIVHRLARSSPQRRPLVLGLSEAHQPPRLPGRRHPEQTLQHPLTACS